MSSLASIIQGEASTYQGQLGVASVIQNRLTSGLFRGNTAFDIANAPGQFEGRAAPTQQAIDIANQLQAGNITDTTGGALYFVSPRAGYSWGGVEGATGPATAAIISGGANVAGDTNFYSDRWGAPSQGFLDRTQDISQDRASWNDPNAWGGFSTGGEIAPSGPFGTGGVQTNPPADFTTGGQTMNLPSIGGNPFIAGGAPTGTGITPDQAAAAGGNPTDVAGTQAGGLSPTGSPADVSTQPGSGLWETTGVKAVETAGQETAKATEQLSKQSADNTQKLIQSNTANTASITTTESNVASAGFSNLWSLFERTALVILGVVLIGGALYLAGIDVQGQARKALTV